MLPRDRSLPVHQAVADKQARHLRVLLHLQDLARAPSKAPASGITEPRGATQAARPRTFRLHLCFLLRVTRRQAQQTESLVELPMTSISVSHPPLVLEALHQPRYLDVLILALMPLPYQMVATPEAAFVAIMPIYQRISPPQQSDNAVAVLELGKLHACLFATIVRDQQNRSPRRTQLVDLGSSGISTLVLYLGPATPREQLLQQDHLRH
mmetsp:Transcript_1952/g.2922  ORF Transcript_1952/g.2922 Transcript_1952/m.2922 type:complete len:210 (-) Transcript_1952:445-1074(-)